MFQFRWEEEYFFIKFNSKSICLIVESLATAKEYNLKRHYTFHKSYSSFDTLEMKTNCKTES